MIQPRSNRIRGKCRYTEACNTTFQGLASDAAKECLWKTCERQYLFKDSALYGSHQVLFVHDENVIECDIDRAEAVKDELSELMIETYAIWCPDVPVGVDAIISPHYCKP